MFTAELVGVEELERAWADSVGIIRQGVAGGVTRAATEGASEARDRHRFKNQSGDLERSIQAIVRGWSGDTFHAVIRASVPYASYVEEGTRPHLIEARRAQALRFIDANGDLRFARIVRHPGTQALPFMGLAYLKAERVLIREIESAVADAGRRLGP